MGDNGMYCTRTKVCAAARTRTDPMPHPIFRAPTIDRWDRLPFLGHQAMRRFCDVR